MIAAVYARKSTEQAGLADDQKSVARQIEHATAYATRKGWHVSPETIFVDDGISGAEFANRPGFLRLMNTLKPRPAFQVLVMSEESRLGREAIETAYALKQIVTAGVRVFFYLEDRERTLDSPTDKIMLSLTAFADELEREKARQRTFDAMSRKARAGHVTGGRTFGYDNIDVPGPTGERSHVIHQINETQAAAIRRIFELAAEGHGLKAITKALNLAGIPSPRPQRGRPAAWAPGSVREVLYREQYRGRRIWNKTRKRDRWGQHRQHDRPASEWMAIDLEALRVVPEALWNAAHDCMKARAETYGKFRRGETGGLSDGRGVRVKYFLTGFAECAQCRGSMQVVSRRKTGRERRYRYTCATYWNRGACICGNGRTVEMTVADHAVHELLANEVLRPSLVERALDRAIEQLEILKSAEHTPGSQREAVMRRLAAIDLELANLSDTAARGGAVPAILSALQTRDEERRRLMTELETLGQARSAPLEKPAALRRQLRALLDDWSGLLTENVAEARPLLSRVLVGRISFAPVPADDGRDAYRLTVPIAFDRVISALVPNYQDLVASPRGPGDNLRADFQLFVPVG